MWTEGKLTIIPTKVRVVVREQRVAQVTEAVNCRIASK